MIHGFRLLICLAFLACAAGAADVRVDASCPWIDRDGYTPVLLTVRADYDALVEVDATLDDNRASTTVEVAAGTTFRRTLLLPGSNRRWSSGVEVRWRTAGRPEDRIGVSPRGYRELDVVLLDPDESFPVKDLRDAVSAQVGAPPDANGYRGSTTTYSEQRFARWAPDELPSRWQGWPAWLTLITTSGGDRRLDDAQRQAIAAWTQAGGKLLVADAAQLAPWRGIGARVAVVERKELIERIQEVWAGISRHAAPVPVPGTGRVPVGGFVAIAVLFALLVGPVNLWWCARRGRRHLLLVTTPLLSLVASVLLLVYGLIADGLHTRRLAVQVLALDAQSGRAAAWTGLSLFAGLAPGRIDLDADDLITVVLAEADDGRNQERTDLVWDGAQRATGGWIPSRANRQLAIATVRPERRRLAFARTAEGWAVTNGFDRPLAALVLTDPEGRPWHLESTVAPGAAAPLAAGAVVLDPPLARLPAAASAAVARGGWTARFDGPLLPLPGPAAVDVVPVASWVVGAALNRSGGGF